MMFGSATYAQSPVVKLSDGGYFCPCIGTLTKSGKGTLITGKEKENSCVFSIYDDQMKVAKTINVDLKQHTYREWKETANVVPTGLSYAFYEKGTRYNDNGEREYYEAFDDEPAAYYNEGMDFSDVTTPEQLVQKLKDAGKISDWQDPYPFTDFKGNMAFMLGGSFYLYDCFGAKYPTSSFYTLIDGKVYRIYGSSSNYVALQYSADNVEWTIDESTMSEYKRNDYVEDMEYVDFDKGATTDRDILLSQTLFNNDDKWEYCVCEYKIIPYSEDQKEIYKTYANEDGTVSVTRYNGEKAVVDRCVVYNEDGKECFAFSNDYEYEEVYRVNGKDYLFAALIEGGDYCKCLYEIEKSTTSIREVARIKSSRVKAEENAVIVEVDDELAGSDVMVANMAGQLMGRGRIEKGSNSARVAMPTHTPGVYVVSLKRGNKVVESHKMILK